jgi:tetratricopeptide (TPR) repeat protein
MARLRKELVTLLLALSVPSVAVPQTHSTATVSGVVFAEGADTHMEHVVVRLCDAGGTEIEQGTTTQAGEFAFRGVQRDRYILTFEAIGFQKAEIHVDLSYGSDKGMTVYLKPVAAPKPLAAPGSKISAHELSMASGARDLVASGRKKLYVDKQPQAALGDLEHAVAIAPDYYEAYFEIAMAYVTLGKKENAKENFRKSIEGSHGTYGDAEVGSGTLLLENGDAEAGEKAIRRGVELNPNSWLGFYELGKLELNRRQLDKALSSAERAKVIAPNTPIVYRLLSNIHMQQKNYNALLGDLDAYIRLDPDSAAGVRAAQLRDQVVQEMNKKNEFASSGSKP